MEWLVTAIVTVVLTTIINLLLFRMLARSVTGGINGFLGQFNEMFSSTVKKGYGLMGSLGGNAKAQKAIQNKVAQGVIEKNYGMLKVLAEKVAGIDVDELIEDYGAENVLQGIGSLLGALKGNGLGGLMGANPGQGNSIPSM